MKTTNSLSGLQGLMYSGQLETKQFSTATIVDYTKLTHVQHEMYTKVMVGIKLYTPEQLYAMNSSKKSKIIKRNKLAQSMLNLWKQEKMLTKSNSLLGFVDQQIEGFTNQFKNSNGKSPNSFVKDLKITNKEPLPELFKTAALKQLLSIEVAPDPNFMCTLSFKDLNISKTDIIQRLISTNFLPNNFATL